MRDIIEIAHAYMLSSYNLRCPNAAGALMRQMPQRGRCMPQCGRCTKIYLRFARIHAESMIARLRVAWKVWWRLSSTLTITLFREKRISKRSSTVEIIQGSKSKAYRNSPLPTALHYSRCPNGAAPTLPTHACAVYLQEGCVR